MLSALNFILVALAAVAAGAVNALAGGGTLITFPMLTAVGIPAVAANITNTVALCPAISGERWRRSTTYADRVSECGWSCQQVWSAG